MNYLLIASCFSLLVTAIQGSNEVPVLAWGSGSELFNFHIPAHRKLSTAEFIDNFLEKLTHNKPSAIVTFVEESLSPEDLVSQDTNLESTYPSLQKIFESDGSTKYLPYVSNPLKALEALSYERHELPSSESSHSLPDSSKVHFEIQLDDAQDDEGRLKLLQRHDRIIKQVCSEVQQKYGRTVCLLTAKRTSWIEPEKTSGPGRKLLQTSDPVKTNSSEDDLIYYFQKNAGLIYTKDLPTLFIKNTKETINLTKPETLVATKGQNALVIHLQASSSTNDRTRMSFNFVLPNMTSTWQLNSVELKYPSSADQSSLLRATSYIGASLGNSFHSPSIVAFEDDNYVLTFKGIQVQYFNPDRDSPEKFGTAEDSVYFFTIPILSGLFVTSLLVTIVLIGLTMIFDVKTMDQFDDPKGKSITINASD